MIGRVSVLGRTCLASLMIAACSGAAAAQSFQPEEIEKILKALPAGAEPAPNIAPRASLEAQKPAPEDLYLSKDPLPTLTRETLELTEAAAQNYLAIVEAGGWPMVPATSKLAPGVSGPAVATLKQRLKISGDLDAANEAGELYDDKVEGAVKHFQDRHGLEQTGAVGAQTLRALNVPAIVRYNQLLASAKRLRATKFAFEPRYVVVNIPSANVEAVEDGKVIRRYVAIVGKKDHPSPTIEAKIMSINLNPTWTVPASIVKNEIIPHMQTDPGYLAREHIRILDHNGVEIDPTTIDWTNNAAASFILRQDSGATNSLGTLRIDMPNKEAVYMHDTPTKSLFASSVRFQSHGCVRVSKIEDLAAWLLKDNTARDNSAKDNSASDQTVWSTEAIAGAIALGTRVDVKLAKPVPVAWIYLTGYATPDHVVHFRNDVYDLDDAIETVASVARPQPPARPEKPAAAAAAPQPTPQIPAAKTLVE